MIKLKLVFIYDGQCPFCNKFAELLELKSGIPEISIKNARENIDQMTSLYKSGYDIDKGAILLKGNEILQGPKAITYICSKVKDPSNGLLILLSKIFISSKRTNFIFPLLLFARRTSLIIKGVPRKLFTKEINDQ